MTLDITLLGDSNVLVDQQPAVAGPLSIAKPVEITIPKIARIVVTPPMAGTRSAQANLRSAEEALVAALSGAETESYPTAITRNENARAARQEIEALQRQIEAMCPQDPALDLQAGVAPLKALLEVNAPDDAEQADGVDLDAVESVFTLAREAEEIAAAVLEEAQRALQSAELSRARLDADQVGAARDMATAREVIDGLPAEIDRDVVVGRLADAKEELARRAEALAQARTTVENLDADRIRRSIANIDIAERQANEERVQLVARIAALESTIAREGPKGPPSILAEAKEAEDVASALCHRLQREADTLGLLRDTLRLAGEDASRTFLGPVTKRAALYVNRILPNSDLSFDDDMGLKTIRRNGIDEACGDLSRGTQEQLAVLTRIAFADLLLEKGAPVSLILDDPLVYSDDARLEAMTDILLDAANRMQVILLTCRAKAFRHPAGNRILLAGV